MCSKDVKKITKSEAKSHDISAQLCDFFVTLVKPQVQREHTGHIIYSMLNKIASKNLENNV